MAEDEVITLDSDDEDTSMSSSSGISTLLGNNSSNNGITIKRIPAAPKVIPRNGQMMRPLPLPAGMGPGAGMQPPMKKSQVPRKPGVFPPFALFSQEQRPLLLQSDPNISFGEIGKKLGEMWHALTETEKEEYRRRAREISDKKMADYQQSLAKMPPQQRHMVNTGGQVKRRKTHGYAIFSTEMRKNLGTALSPQETANVIAESWRSASPAVRREYEERAARINGAQERKLQPQPIANASSGGSGLRISSVSSLSPQASPIHKRPPPHRIQLSPSASLIRRPPQPQPSQMRPKLPSGITISRVEPEISILDEHVQAVTMQTHYTAPPMPTPRVTPSPQVMSSRGRGGLTQMRRPVMSPAAQAAMRVKAQLRAQTNVSMQTPNILHRRGRGSSGFVNGGQRLPLYASGATASCPLKRPLPHPNMPGLKKARTALNTSAYIEQKLCRSCGFINPVGCKLSERADILESLTEFTMTHIDLVKDQNEGYPSEICRRCMSAVTNFANFKKTFQDGQNKLKLQFNPPMTEMLPLNADLITNGSGSTTMTAPLASVNIEESILPDLDCDVDFGENPANIPQPVNIKDEKVRVLTPTSLGKISIKAEMSNPMNSENIVQGGKEEKVINNNETDPFSSTTPAPSSNEPEKVKDDVKGDVKDDVKDNVKDAVSGDSKKSDEKDTPLVPNANDPLTCAYIGEKEGLDTAKNEGSTSKKLESEQTSSEDHDQGNSAEKSDDVTTDERSDDIANGENSESNAEKSDEDTEALESNDPGTQDHSNEDDQLENFHADEDNSQTSIGDANEESLMHAQDQVVDNDEHSIAMDDESSNMVQDTEDEMHLDQENNDESSNAVVPQMNDDSSSGMVPNADTNQSFVSCSQDEDQAFNNASNEDPFESFMPNEDLQEPSMDIGEGSQDANDAFVPESDAHNMDEQETVQDNLEQDHDDPSTQN